MQEETTSTESQLTPIANYLQNPYYLEVAEFIKPGKDLVYNNENGACYDNYIVIDNNVLTDLAKAANNANSEFKQLISSTPNPVFIIPEIIFEESTANLEHNIQWFNSVYREFYKTLSEIAPIYIVSMTEHYQWHASNFTSEDVAFTHYHEIATTLNDNQQLRHNLSSATSIQEVETAIRSISKDCGERIAFIYTHIMIAEKLPNIIFLSKEIKGVYRKWLQVCAEDKALLNKVYVKNSGEYIEAFKVKSFQKWIFDFARQLPDEQKTQFINNIRHDRCVHENVHYYSKSLEFAYETGVNNETFIGLVKNQDIIFMF